VPFPVPFPFAGRLPDPFAGRLPDPSEVDAGEEWLSSIAAPAPAPAASTATVA
jgi:hypothetical protein